MAKQKTSTAVLERNRTAAAKHPQPASKQSPEPGTSGGFRAVTGFFLRYGWIALLALSVMIVGYYILIPSRAYFHSDTTDTLMWAAASSESGTLFNSDFHYACVLPIGTQLIMQLLIPFFGVSMTTHVLGMLIFFLLFTGSMVWMLKEMGWSWNWTAFAVFCEVLMMSSSEKLREIFWGHTIYYSLGVLFCFVGLALLFRWMKLRERKAAIKEFDPKDRTDYKLIAVTVLIFLWFLLTGMDQLIAMVLFSIPVIAAFLCERFLDSDSKLLSGKNFQPAVLAAIMAAGMLLGYLITGVLAKDITANYENGFSSYSAMSEWMNNLLKFPEHWFSLLGVTGKDGDPMLSGDSIKSLLALLASLVLLVLPLIALCCYRKLEDARLRILTLTYWFMTLLVMMGYTCGKLSSSNWRLSPIAAMAVVVSAAFLRWAVSQVSMQRIISLMMVPVVCCCCLNVKTILSMSPTAHEDTTLYKLAECLERNGFTYGYATFWNANSLTVISDSAVECRSVWISEDRGVTNYGYQTADSWYLDQPGVNKYFLLMTPSNKETLEASDSVLLSREHYEITAEGYIIWVFNENLFS